MASGKLFKNIDLDKIHINKEIFKNYVELYNIFNSQVREVDPKVSKEMIKILEDVCIMAVKMNKKILEYKNKKSNEKINETIKISKDLLKKFGKK